VDIDPASTPHGELMGSPMYMSPEAVRGARDLTPQSDQYSLGVVLYECVTGRAPFEAESLLAVLDAVARGDFEPPRRFRPDLSSTVEEAILRAMNPDPRLRFANVRELGRVLCHAADHRTRLLWQPTFGSSDSLGRTTAVLGSTPLRTAAPLNLPAAVASRGGSRRTWLGLGALGLAALAYWGWGRLQLAPLSVGGNPAAVRALQPPPELPMPAPSQDHAEHPSPNVTEAALLAARPPPRPHVAGVPVASSSTTAVPNRAIPPRAAPRAVPPGAAARSTVAPRATTPRVQREAAPANPVAPARAREPAERAGSGVPEARPALGPNRAPILD
jgi:serine/threonine-protein kinase